MPPSVHNSCNNSGRQPVPCIFFQKGLCLKGDKCSFLHGTNSIGNKVIQATTTMLTGDLSSTKKPLSILQNCSQERKVPADSSKPPGLQLNAKLALNAKNNNIPGNEIGPEKLGPPAGSIDEEASKPYHPSSTVKESSQIKSRSLHLTHAFNERNFQNDKEVEEHLRESSPGFDVLVDDELGDAGYFHREDHFGRMGAHDQRNLSSVSEYDMDHPSDYNSLHDVDREMLHDLHAYESYQMSGQFGWDQHRNPSEIISGGLSCREGGNHVKSENRDVFEGSDLRYHLSKQRRVNGLRSVVSNNSVPESHVGERNHRESSQRDLQNASFQESSLSSRLRGRIKFPGRSAVDDREMDIERSRGRLQKGRLIDRLKGRLQDGSSSMEGRSSSGPWKRRETWNNDDAHFAGPKSLAELKSVAQQIKSQESSPGLLGQLQSRPGDQQSDVDLSFEGPKPLSVLLKRKREGETAVAAASKGGPSVNVEENSEEVYDSRLTGSVKSSAIAQVHDSPQTNEDVRNCQPNKGKEVGLTTVDVNPPREKGVGMVVEDAVDEHELDSDDRQDGVFDYEQADDVEYNDDVGNADEEYLDDEDGDDFAKKVGVVLT